MLRTSVLRPAALLAALLTGHAACGSAPRGKQDARGESGAAAARVAVPAHDAGSARVAPAAGGLGEVAIHVTWTGAPAAARRPGPGCGGAAPPALAPTTTWGIPEALVTVEGGGPSSAAPAPLSATACAISPRLVALPAGAPLVVASAAPGPLELEVTARPEVGGGAPAAASPGPARRVLLPASGHQVAIALVAGTHALRLGEDRDAAWAVISDGGGRSAVTDATGAVVLRDLPVGAHAISAWLPPRGGQPARRARGEVTVVAGERVEATLELGAP